jgi:drug/metabolite transporter (DMT)-like permease
VTPADPAGVPVPARSVRLRASVSPGRRRLAELALVVVMLGWAVNFITVKGTGAQIPPMTFAWVRFSVAGLLLLALLWWREGRLLPPRRDVLPIAALGLVGFTAYQLLWASAIQLITAGDSALLVATTPVLAALLAVVARSDTLTPAKLLGALLSFAGVAIIVGRGGSEAHQVSLLGDLVTLAAAVCWAAYTSFGAPVLRRHSPLAVAAWAISAGALGLAPFGLIAALGADWSLVQPVAVAGWIYSAVIAAGISNVIVFDGIRQLGPARAVAFQFLVPLFTVLIGALILSEPVTAGQVVGGLVIVAGVLLTRRDRGLRRRTRGPRLPTAPGPSAQVAASEVDGRVAAPAAGSPR